MRRTPPFPVPTPLASRRRHLSRRITSTAALLAVAGSLLVGSGAQAASPVRGVTGVDAVTAGTAPATTARPLSWAPPALTDPVTVTISATNREPRLQAGQDYIIKMPSTPLDVTGGLVLAGGRNVVLIGGEIKISKPGTTTNALRGLYLKGQTGTVHVEGLRITGATLAEGINLDERDGATVQLQNIRVDRVRGTAAGLHADVLQTWGGPKVLRIDGLTGYTTYQGFFLLPTQYGSPAPDVFDLRNVNIVGESGSKYLMWRDAGTWPIELRNVWAHTSQTGAPRHQFLRDNGTDPWAAVREGKPATGDFVPATMAGVAYTSPGYSDSPGIPPSEPASGSTADHTVFRYDGSWSVSTWRGEHFTKDAGRTASITAQVGAGGGTVSLQGILGPNKGIAAISIDGGPEISASQYRNPGSTGTFFTTPQLAAGAHTITVRVTGTRASGATDSYVALTGATTTNGTLTTPLSQPAPAPALAPAAGSTADHTVYRYGGSWSVSTARGEHFTKDAGRTASITAQVGAGGGTVSLQGILGPNKGIAAISIDGGPEISASQYRNPASTGTFFTTPQLSAGAHTITVRVTGTRASGGTDSYVALTGATTTNGTLTTPLR